MRTCTQTVIRKFYLLKNILAYRGYSPTSPFFLLLTEHKHCDNAATNSNSENARSRMLASLRGNVGTGTKEDESSSGRVWAAVTARSRLARVLKLTNRLLLQFSNFFFGPRYTADSGVLLYINFLLCISSHSLLPVVWSQTLPSKFLAQTTSKNILPLQLRKSVKFQYCIMWLILDLIWFKLWEKGKTSKNNIKCNYNF